MKNRLIFIASTISIILLGYLLIDNGYFNKYNRISACKDIKKGNIQIILWSDSDVTPQLAKIYSEYGIRTNQIVVTNYNWKGVEAYNQRMNKELQKKMGQSYYIKFRTELDSLSQTWILIP